MYSLIVHGRLLKHLNYLVCVLLVDDHNPQQSTNNEPKIDNNITHTTMLTRVDKRQPKHRLFYIQNTPYLQCRCYWTIYRRVWQDIYSAGIQNTPVWYWLPPPTLAAHPLRCTLPNITPHITQTSPPLAPILTIFVSVCSLLLTPATDFVYSLSLSVGVFVRKLVENIRLSTVLVYFVNCLLKAAHELGKFVIRFVD